LGIVAPDEHSRRIQACQSCSANITSEYPLVEIAYPDSTRTITLQVIDSIAYCNPLNDVPFGRENPRVLLS